MTRRLSRALLVALVGLAAAPGAAHAQSGNPLTGFTARVLDGGGDPESRAGAHPDRLEMAMAFDPAQANAKDMIIDLPAGVAGNPNAVESCSRETMSGLSPAVCPAASQVGMAVLDIGFFALSAEIHRVEGDRDHLVTFGFKTFGVTGRLFVDTLPDGRARLSMTGLNQDTPLLSMTVELWGVPADHQAVPPPVRRGLLALPVRCDGLPLTATLRVNTYQQPAAWHALSAELGPPLSGCDTLAFDPQLDFALDSPNADSPTGARMTLAVPQSDDPDGQVSGRVRQVEIDFPAGMALSPGAANGLDACPEEAVGLGQTGATRCPASARIGTAQLTSSLLENVVHGSVYLGRQQSETDYRMYVVLSGDAIDFKLAGELHADPATGQLSATIPGIPELAFDELTLSFAGGPHAALATSLACGAGTASATLTPHHGGTPVVLRDGIVVDADPAGRPCPAALPFAPTFVAGTSVTRAGAAAPLAVTVGRAPGEQLLDRLTVSLPEGVSARVAAVERCPQAGVAGGACPAGSRVGSATAEAGSGASPFALDGDVFLTGPYRGAPFGMAIVFRGIAGPFDLGTIVVRSALRVDARTGRVTVETDQLPGIVRGVPLRMQTVAFDIDRPGFIYNPTSCVPREASAVLRSDAGAVVRARSRFAVGGCRSLRFRPSLTMAITDRDELRAEGHPGVRLRYRAPSRGANLSELRFEMPAMLQPSVTGPTAICALTQLEDERCPAASRIGTVAGRTPLLSKPLRGPVYMVQPPGNGVADVWAIMRGQGVTMKLRMKNVVKGGVLNGRLIGTLVDLPDIPLSSLTMTFASGDRGMFTLARDACAGGRARVMRAKSRMTAHSSAARRAKVRVRVGPGCGRAAGASRSSR